MLRTPFACAMGLGNKVKNVHNTVCVYILFYATMYYIYIVYIMFCLCVAYAVYDIIDVSFNMWYIYIKYKLSSNDLLNLHK